MAGKCGVQMEDGTDSMNRDEYVGTGIRLFCNASMMIKSFEVRFGYGNRRNDMGRG